MAERYSRIFTLSENLYAIGSPIIIEAGALLKDNKTGDVLAQLKMKSISPENIKAVKVKLSLFDVSGKLLNDSIEYQYLDLDIARDVSFGSKAAIKFEEPTTRSFTVNVTEVIFESSVWNGTTEKWETLCEQDKICDVLKDKELVKQFELKYGTPSSYAFLQEKDLWHCVCGGLNKNSEAKCHVCKKSLDELKEFNLSTLTREKEQRLEAERQEAEAQAERERQERQKEEIARKEAEEQRKRNTKKAIVVVAYICVLLVIGFIFNSIIIPTIKYNKALSLINNEEYSEAIVILESLNGYKDSESKITEYKSREEYEKAIILKNEGKYRSAMLIFEKLGDTQQVEECKKLRESQPKQGEQDNMEAVAKLKESLQKYNVGDEVLFGRYEQDGDTQNGSENIEWIVLEKRDNRMLLLSTYALYSDQYNIGCSGWKSSIMRKWLNSSFINSAFDNTEKDLICMVDNKTSSAGTTANGNSEDKVFLLSIEEVEKYLTKDNRNCQPTSMAAKISRSTQDNYCIWTLRNPGKHEDVLIQESSYERVYKHVDYMTYVDITGQIIESGKENSDYCNIRPAIWVSLDE